MFLIETFLKPSKPDCLLTIPGYTLHRRDKEGAKKGGGIVAFIVDHVKASRNYNLEEDCVELMWLNVHPHKSHRPILVGGLYCPPSTDTNTDSKIENAIETAYLRNQETIISGDFNIDSLNTSTFNNHRLIKSLKSMHMSQVVCGITRPVSSTCLDHVYTSHPDQITRVYLPNIELADHIPIFICRKYSKIKKDPTNSLITYRDFKNVNHDKLLEELSEAPWDTAFVFDNVDDVLASLESLVNGVLDNHLPIKQKRVKKLVQPALMNGETVQSIIKRDQLLKKARNSNLPDDWATYKRKKREVTNLIKAAKRNTSKSPSIRTKETQKVSGRL